MMGKILGTYQDSQKGMYIKGEVAITAGEQPCSPAITFRRINIMKKPMAKTIHKDLCIRRLLCLGGFPESVAGYHDN